MTRRRTKRRPILPRESRAGPAPGPGAAAAVPRGPSIRWERWLGPALIAGALVVMLHWSWLKWPDVYVDFGRELYQAWQLSAGKVLYRDLAHVQGPLSPYVNSTWFRLFGTSLRVLVWCNLALLVILVSLQYRVFSQLSDRLGAAVAGLVFVTMFACGQQVRIGNYNYLCPYRHEVTHGILLSFAAFHFLLRYQRRRRAADLGAMGLTLGLLFLTKPEVFLAALAGLGTGLILTLWAQRTTVVGAARATTAVGGGLLVPIIGAFFLLSLAMPFGVAFHSVLGGWPAVFDTAYNQSAFVRSGLGIDKLDENLRQMLVWTGWYLVVFALPALFAVFLRKPGWHRPVCAGLVFAGLSLLAGSGFSQAYAARPLPLLVLGLILFSVASFARRGGDQDAAALWAGRVAFLVFAFALLGKMLLNSRLYHYGFALAMPATLVCTLALVSWIPRAIDRRGGYGWIVRAAAGAVLLAIVVLSLKTTAFWYRQKQVTVGAGPDRFLADARGAVVNQTLARLAESAAPDDCLVALPKGLILNYLARRVNPTRYTTEFDPTEVFYFGEGNILGALEDARPEYVVLALKNPGGSVDPYFGRDYGQRLHDWVQRHYRALPPNNAKLIQVRGFRIELTRRADPESSTPARGASRPMNSLQPSSGE